MLVTTKMLRQAAGSKNIEARSTDLSFYVGDIRVELNELDHAVRIDSEKLTMPLDLTISKSNIKHVIEALTIAQNVLDTEIEIKTYPMAEMMK